MRSKPHFVTCILYPLVRIERHVHAFEIDGDGCTTACISEFCGDGEIDTNGPDGLWNTLDDEICDDGNEIDGD